MSDLLSEILFELNNDIKNKLKDPFINSYSEYKYKRYDMLLTYLLDEFSKKGE